MERITVIGAGLAGCEAAWQIARRGVDVTLYEMKPLRRQEAHTSDDFAELVCSNSLRGDRPENASGLLKEEMRALGSLIMACADETRVPAGGALAVDREGFARLVTQRIQAHPRIKVVHEEVEVIPREGMTIAAPGPMADGALAEDIARLCGQELHFFDAVAPIVYRDSIDMDVAFAASRYDKGGDDYINCPMDQAQYEAFREALITARVAPLHGAEEGVEVFEGCLPVEVMAARGMDTLRHGPLKPMGLTDPRTGRWPHAVAQLRQDDRDGVYYNLVGFQTRLAWPEQKRVFSMIPGLEGVRLLRYGEMHRSTYIDAPGVLGQDFSLLAMPDIALAGQITGVEGYLESAASGYMAGMAMARKALGLDPVELPATMALGALGQYAARGLGGKYVPMHVTFGIMDGPQGKIKGKKNRAIAYANASRQAVADLKNELLKGVNDDEI